MANDQSDGITRRSILKTGAGGIVGASILGQTVVGSVAGATPYTQLHPDDKHTVSVERYEHDKNLRRTVEDSPALKRTKTPTGIVIYLDEEYVKEEMIDGTQTTQADASLSEQIASTQEAKERRKRHQEGIGAAEAAIEESKQAADTEPVQFSISDGEMRASEVLTMPDMHVGDYGGGGVIGHKSRVVDFIDDKLHCEIIGNPPAAGQAYVWTWLGAVFDVTGGGETMANIIADYTHAGTVWSAVGAQSTLKSKFRVENLTQNSSWEHVTFNVTAGGPAITDKDVYNRHRRPSLSVFLQSGDTYRVTVDLLASIDVHPVSGATADMGHYIDYSNRFSFEHLRVRRAEVHY